MKGCARNAHYEFKKFGFGIEATIMLPASLIKTGAISSMEDKEITVFILVY